MVDYDGEDILETYLNGLAWTALTKPSFYSAYEREDSVYANAMIFNQTNIDVVDWSASSYRLIHTVNIKFTHTTKALAYTHFLYALAALMDYTGDGTIKINVTRGPVSYTRKRKEFNIICTVEERKSR